MDREELETYEFSEGPIDAIVVGHDTEFTFRKLSIANNLLLQNPDALLVATNHDSFDIGTPPWTIVFSVFELDAVSPAITSSHDHQLVQIIGIFQEMVVL